MEKNNEKMSHPYVAPETVIVTIGGDSAVMQSFNPGSGDTDSDF